MNEEQVEFYNALDEQERYIIQVAALMATNISVYDLNEIVAKTYKVQPKKIIEVLNQAVAVGVLRKEAHSYGGSLYYYATLKLITALYPLLDANKDLLKLIRKTHYRRFYTDDTIAVVSDLIYCLLFDEAEYKLQEAAFIQQLNFRNSQFDLPDFSEILLYEPYEKVLGRLGGTLLNEQLMHLRENFLQKLGSLDILNQRFERIRTMVDPGVAYLVTPFEGQRAFHAGMFDQACEAPSYYGDFDGWFIQAVKSLVQGEVAASLMLVEKGMKEQRKMHRGETHPVCPEYALFYFIALSCSPSENAAPIFDKVLKRLEKAKVTEAHDWIIEAIAAYALNNKTRLTEGLGYLKVFTANTVHGMNSLLSIIAYYVINQQPATETRSNCFSLIQKASKNGFHILAYEALYALRQWTSSEEMTLLYETLSNELGYPPALSRLKHQEAWEQSLNAFLALGKTKGINPDARESNEKNRVVYYLDMKEQTVRPVLLTRTKSGWTKGRNIALKSFSELNTEGMNEQDLRVAKHVKRHDYGWGTGGINYEFSQSVFKELTGHPYLYIEGSDNVPMELIASQPNLLVKQTKNGYLLESNIKATNHTVVVEKETNTQYRVYDLSKDQKQLLDKLIQEQIVVPDRGKEKLLQVLAVFSSYMNVQSDLHAGDSANVRQVEADARIRVQLLPFGNGLKVELFSKPFGDRPPYCKPGKGGKSLFANDKNGQLQVLRNLELEQTNASLLLDEIQTLETVDTDDELIAFQQPQDVLYLLEILANHNDVAVTEWPEGVKYRLKGKADFSQLSLRIRSKTNWFELEGEIRVDEQSVISLTELMHLTARSHSRFVEIKPGEFLALSEQLKKQLEALSVLTAESKEGLHLNKYAAVSAGELLEESGQLTVDKTWKSFQQRVKESLDATYVLPTTLNAELRPYQEEAFFWMASLAAWDAGACLADDMGLGKTIEALTILLHRASLGPALVVCPLSVLPNWVREVERFAPSLTIRILSTGNRAGQLETMQPNEVLITTYGLLQSEEAAFSTVSFATVVLDEAHTIKNASTKTAKAALQLTGAFRLALTGTPIQNNLGEIWNLFHFLNPGLLGSLKQFTDRFVKNDTPAARKQLKRLLAPFILRRTKSAVLDELPAKTEIVQTIELSEAERAFYEALRRQAVAAIEAEDGTPGVKHIKALAEITRLRQACCHPSLVNQALQLPSSKLNALLEMVAELKENGHRALVFSQFVAHLSLIRAALDQQHVTYQYLDGSTPVAERSKRVDAFQRGEGDLFLISLKAGGLGLNLTTADFVIHMDPWWNPAVEDQASDRTHRIGQQRPVTVYRLVAKHTIEEKIINLHHTKRDLADSLLEGSDQAARLSVTDLLALIAG